MFKSDSNETNSMPRKKKMKISLTIDEGLLDWIDKEIEKFTFQSRSHAVEHIVFKFKEAKEKEKENNKE